MPIAIRILVFSICVLEGYLSSFPKEQRVIRLAEDGFLKAIDWVIAESKEGRTDTFLYHEVVYILSEVILYAITIVVFSSFFIFLMIIIFRFISILGDLQILWRKRPSEEPCH